MMTTTLSLPQSGTALAAAATCLLWLLPGTDSAVADASASAPPATPLTAAAWSTIGLPVALPAMELGFLHARPAAVGLPAVMLATLEAELELATMPPLHGPCDNIAFTTLVAALEQARADYLFEVAKCVNLNAHFGQCLRELRDGYREARDEAREQYHARLEVCALFGGNRYDPHIDPRDFSSTVNNRYFRLVPGRTMVYRKQTPEGLEEIEVTTLRETAEIDGVECAVVRDLARLDGVVIEDTIDWYAQHSGGAVWYLGEIAQNFEAGQLDNLDGSWRSGKDGALPGVIMKSDPQRGDAYRQELLLNEAEDLAVVAGRGRRITVPWGTFEDCLQTEDFSPLEPGVREQKFYAPGLGVVLEVDGAGGRLELVLVIDR